VGIPLFIMTDYWLLATGYWQLATGYWQLATGNWQLATGYWLLATGYWLLATRDVDESDAKVVDKWGTTVDKARIRRDAAGTRRVDSRPHGLTTIHVACG